MSINEAPGVYADALLRDERGSLLFCSLWGRDTAIQELLARLSVSIEEGGLRSLRLEGPQGTETIHIDRMPSIEKLTGRLPPKNLFGNLVQLWLFDRLAIEPDRANRRALLLQRQTQDADTALWALVRNVIHVPLLDAWKDVVLDVFQQRGWIRWLRGINVDAVFVDLSADDVEAEVSRLVRERRLSIDTDQFVLDLKAA
jgi:hypothetical protein